MGGGERSIINGNEEQNFLTSTHLKTVKNFYATNRNKYGTIKDPELSLKTIK